jgi:MerR family redox-sensitive transcriptional activator SoxR
MTVLENRLSVGELAARAGVATSALRYYESLGLISADRTVGGQRRYARTMLRRVAFVKAAQRVGLGLDEVGDALASLPDERTPTKADWDKVVRVWQRRIDERIAELERLRNTLGGCVGCGCLSLTKCKLYNADDIAASRGPGAQWLLRDSTVPQSRRDQESS